MAASIKEISDALIETIAGGVDVLNENTVSIFTGDIERFIEDGGNAPFVGVKFAGVSYKWLNPAKTVGEETVSFDLTLIAEDFRGPGYSMESGYEIIDRVRDCLAGSRLGLESLAPLQLSAASFDQNHEDKGLSVFDFNVSTWQVIDVAND